MSKLKNKPKVLTGPDHFAQDMLLECWRNHKSLEGLSTEMQGLGMEKIFADHDLVFGSFPDMSKPRGSDFALIKGSIEELLEQQGLGATGVLMTAFMVNDRAEAETFQQIYLWRQREIDSRGKASVEMKRFWERMTPRGRIESAHERGLDGTVREWAQLMEDLSGAANLLDRYRRNTRSS